MGARPSRTEPRSTEGAFEIAISTTGMDPPDRLVIKNQAEATAWGAFASIAGAVAALPEHLLHAVTLRLPSGTWVLPSSQLGDIARIRTDANLTLAGADQWTQTPGTPASMAVVSSDGAGNVTLAADPGLTANEFEGHYLIVLSGKDAGQYKPIVTHGGTAVVVAGGFSGGLDGTSVVQIATRATTIEVNEQGTAYPSVVLDFACKSLLNNSMSLELWGVNIVPPTGRNTWWISGRQGTIMLSGGTRFVEGGIFGGLFNVLFQDCVIDVSGGYWAGTAVSLQGGFARTSWGSSRPMLLIGDGAAAASAIAVGSYGGNSGIGPGGGAYIFGAQHFSKWVQAFIKGQYTGCAVTINVSSGVPIRSDQSAAYAVLLEKGAVAYVQNLATFATSTFKGSTNDFSLDGSVVDSWSNLDADSDETMTSTRLSMILKDS